MLKVIHYKWILASIFVVWGYGLAQAQELSVDELENQSEDVVQQVQNGTINWTEQYVESLGESVIDTSRFKNLGQARAMAQRGAVVVAQRNLLEVVQGVFIKGKTTVKDFMTQSDEVTTRVEGVLRNAQQVGDAEFTEFGTVKVKMRVPLYNSTGLASAFVAEMAKEKVPVGYNLAAARAPQKTKSKKGRTQASQSPEQEVVFQVEDGAENIQPQMFPEIYDESGKLLLRMLDLYDPSKGKFPKVVKTADEVYEKYKKDPTKTIIDLAVDGTGKLIAKAQNKAKLEKWLKVGLEVIRIAKKIILF